MISRRGSADEFDAALRGRRTDADVRELVRLAEDICATAAEVAPAEDFRLGLRERLMTEAATALQPSAVDSRATAAARTAAPGSLGFRHRAARLSAAAIVAVGGVGLVASSAQALPGDMLYSVKRGVENVELALQRSDESRGEYQLSQARERLAEAAALAEKDQPDLAADSLADFREQAESGSADLFDHYAQDGSAESVEAVNEFAVDASDTIASLADVLPTGSDDPLTRAASTVRQIADQARLLCLECSSPDLVDLIAAPAPALTRSPAPTVPPAPPVSAAPPSSTAPTPRATTGTTTTPPAQPSPTPLLPALPTPTADGGIPVVTPLVNGLLGGNGQEGLVPGLLDGLLGGGS